MFPAFFLVVCLAVLSACSGTYGRLAVNSDVKALFERHEVLPGHRYFYIESESWPRAVIGIHERYTLQSDFWCPVELTPEKLGRWLDFDHDQNQPFMGGNGSDILDENGRKIGVWYALKDAHDRGAVKMIDAKTVNIILVKRNTHRIMLLPWRYDKD